MENAPEADGDFDEEGLFTASFMDRKMPSGTGIYFVRQAILLRNIYISMKPMKIFILLVLIPCVSRHLLTGMVSP